MIATYGAPDLRSWAETTHTCTLPRGAYHLMTQDNGVVYVHSQDLRAYWSNNFQNVAASVRDFTQSGNPRRRIK